MATSEETAPIPVPVAMMPTVPGSSRVAFGLMSSTICKATKQTKQVKKIASGRASMLDANRVPSKVPKRIPGVICSTIFHRTARC